MVARFLASQAIAEYELQIDGVDSLSVTLADPGFTAGPVSIGGEAGSQRIAEIRAGLNGQDLLDGLLRLNRLVLSGAEIQLERDADGNFTVPGLPQGSDDGRADSMGEFADSGVSVDLVELTDSIIRFRDVNGALFELSVTRAVFGGIGAWQSGARTTFALDGSLNGIGLSLEGEVLPVGERRSLYLFGNLNNITQAIVSRLAGIEPEVPVQGALDVSFTHLGELDADGKLAGTFDGIIAARDVDVLSADGGSILLPEAHMAVSLSAEASASQPTKTVSKFGFSAGTFSVNGVDGGSLNVDGVALRADNLRTTDISGSRGQSFREGFMERFRQRRSEEPTSVATLITDVVVAAAFEIASYDLVLSGSPRLTIERAELDQPPQADGGKLMVAARKIDLRLPDVSTEVHANILAFQSGLQFAIGHADAEFGEGGNSGAVTAEGLRWDSQFVWASTDGAETDLGFDLLLASDTLAVNTQAGEHISLGQGVFASRQLNLRSGPDTDGRVGGALSADLRDLNVRLADGTEIVSKRFAGDFADFSLGGGRTESISFAGTLAGSNWRVRSPSEGILVSAKSINGRLPSLAVSQSANGFSVHRSGEPPLGLQQPVEDMGYEPEILADGAPPELPIPRPRPHEDTRISAAEPPATKPAGNISLSLRGITGTIQREGGPLAFHASTAETDLSRFSIWAGAGRRFEAGGRTRLGSVRVRDEAAGIVASAGAALVRVGSASLQVRQSSPALTVQRLKIDASKIKANQGAKNAEQWATEIEKLTTDLRTFEARDSIAASGDTHLEGVHGYFNDDGRHSFSAARVRVDGGKLTDQAFHAANLSLTRAEISVNRGKPPVGASDKNTSNTQANSAPKHVAPVSFDAVDIGPGSLLNIQDASVGKPLAIRLLVDDGRVAPLDLGNLSRRSNVRLSARVGPRGKLKASGTTRLNAPHADAVFDVQVSSFPVQVFSPLAESEFGFGLDRGDLTGSIRGTAKDERLDGAVSMRLTGFILPPISKRSKKRFQDKFTFSPEYVVEILKDNEGIIRIKGPVSGTVDDPKLDLTGLRNKAIEGVLRSLMPQNWFR